MPASVPLPGPGGWKHNASGKLLKNGQPRWAKGNHAFFKHSQPLQGGDVWSMRMVEGGSAWVGFSNEGFDVERVGETGKNNARVGLGHGHRPPVLQV